MSRDDAGKRIWWVSTIRFTVRVEVVDGLVVRAAPIASGFVGQRWENLLKWCRSVGGLKIEELSRCRACSLRLR